MSNVLLTTHIFNIKHIIFANIALIRRNIGTKYKLERCMKMEAFHVVKGVNSDLKLNTVIQYLGSF